MARPTASDNTAESHPRPRHRPRHRHRHGNNDNSNNSSASGSEGVWQTEFDPGDSSSDSDSDSSGSGSSSDVYDTKVLAPPSIDRQSDVITAGVLNMARKRKASRTSSLSAYSPTLPSSTGVAICGRRWCGHVWPAA